MRGERFRNMIGFVACLLSLFKKPKDYIKEQKTLSYLRIL